MSWTHEHSWKLAAPPERVYKALTDSEEFSRWFAEHAEISVEPGGRHRFWGRRTLGGRARQSRSRAGHHPARARTRARTTR